MADLRYLAAALGMLSIAWRLARWTGRNVRDVAGLDEDPRGFAARFRRPPVEPVTVVPHRAEWAVDYERERAVLADAIQGFDAELFHIGGTAVPGVAARPVIDIMLAISPFSLPAPLKGRLEGLGYHFAPERGDDQQLFLWKGRPHTHHLIVVERGGAEMRRRLNLREWLRGDTSEAQSYGDEKARLARKHAKNQAAYREALSAYMKARQETLAATRRSGMWETY
jgi:GrpB-like predicted nucleotidyltransferase (UPF0157 family)